MYMGKEEILFENKDDISAYMYIPTRGIVALVDNEIKNRISSLELDISKQIEQYPYIDLAELYNGEQNSVPYLALNISDGCQLRCEYCYLSAGEVPETMLMSAKEAKIIIDAYIKYLKLHYNTKLIEGNNVWISFYGGAEPTFNWDTFKETVEYLSEVKKNENINIRLRITTNGFYKKTNAEYIAEKFDSILLSLDGCKAAHNYHRKTNKGKDSFEQVYENAKVYYNKKKKFAIRMTLSKYTYSYLNDSLEFFSKEFPGVAVLIGKCTNIGRAYEQGMDSIDNYVDTLIETISQYKGRLSFTLFDKKQIKDIHLCYCGATRGKTFIVSSDMIIRSCAHVDVKGIFEIGRILENEVVIDENSISLLEKRFEVSNNEYCKECIAKYYCAGGCPSNRLYSISDWKEACVLQKRIFISKLNYLFKEKEN